MSLKNDVIVALFEQCQQRQNLKFSNDDVKIVSRKLGFGNPFDVTKIDTRAKLPKVLQDNDYCIVHLGNGKHMFFKGIDIFYHAFEPIDTTVDWRYKKSLLNQYNSSESNILSVANNQRILHDFLFGKDDEFTQKDIDDRPKTYFPHRTKTNLEYSLGNNDILTLENIQIEIDLTIEYKGIVGIFEAKNGYTTDFSIYQLYHPYLYYHNARRLGVLLGKIKNIFAVYLVRTKEIDNDILNMWSYIFTNPLDITTIQLVKSCAYRLLSE